MEDLHTQDSFQRKGACINACLCISRTSSSIAAPHIASSSLPLSPYICDDSYLQDCTVNKIIELSENQKRESPQK